MRQCVSPALPWELGLPLAGTSSCWDIQMWELQVWDIPGIWGHCRLCFPFVLGPDGCGGKTWTTRFWGSEASAGGLRDARGSGVALCWLERKLQLGHSCWCPGGEQPGCASSSRAVGFCRGPLALGVLGRPVTPLSHLGADPCGETEAAAFPALFFLIQGWDRHLVALIWGRIRRGWEH